MSQLIRSSASILPCSDEIGSADSESLFERFAWLYIFCRENLFRDDTRRIISTLWPRQPPLTPARLIEVGCGPGFYSCRLAQCFSKLSVLGVDCSPTQLQRARQKAEELGLKNCTFERSDVLTMSWCDSSFDYLVASRLFTVLPHRERAVAEMFRVLQPGGRCFIAEPRYFFWASLPLLAMWILASLTSYGEEYREPRRASVLGEEAFQRLLASQPWKKVQVYLDGRYQYALCEKG